MPALLFFKRKWLIACDDLVIPFAIGALIRLMWLTTTVAITWLKIKNCEKTDLLDYFLYVAIGDLLITFVVSFAISLASSKGSVLEVEKRNIVSTLLYVKFITILLEIGLASLGIWLFTQMQNTCVVKEVFIKVTTITVWIYFFIVIFGVKLCYDSLGASKYWNRESNSNSLNFFKKAESIWKFRLKFFCCCADISENNDFIYVEISTFLASFLNTIDLVPTDILAGIITLSQKHALERRLHLLNIQYLSKSEAWLKCKPIPEWMTPQNAHHFLRIAKSTYGWMAFFNTFRPWHLCRLCSHMRCCLPCYSEDNSMTIDSCCYCNFAAVQKITGFSDSDIIFASFENNIHEPAFYIVLDHNKKSIVIAIRGTGSFSDLVTDIDAEALYFPSETELQYKCHRGVLRSALFLENKIKNMNLLEGAFTEHPSYTLVITGHSLGASIAAVLGFLLRPKYPTLQCYAYGPLAAISFLGIEESLDFVFSVVVGDDMAPRLSRNAGKKLRLEIMDSLRESKIPKYRLLIAACWYHVTKYFKSNKPYLVSEGYDNKIFENDNESISQPTYGEQNETSSLYAPGRILYFEKNNWTKPIWLTGLNFQKIIINPDMIADHQPHKIQFMLNKYTQNLCDVPMTAC